MSNAEINLNELGLAKEDIIATATYLAAACDTIWRERNGVGGMAPVPRGPGARRFKEETLRELAVKYLNLAVEFEDSGAMNALAKMYQDKGAYPANTCENPGVKSVELLMRSAEKGNPNACADIGMFYLGKPVPGFGGDFGSISYDAEKGLSYLFRALEGGNMKCGRHIGLCYKNGVGTEQNFEKAYYYYCQAADRGDSTAKLYKGDCLLKGEGTEQNVKEAIEIYKSMVENNEHDRTAAAYALACIYRDGVYAEKDDELAKKYFDFVVKTATPHENNMLKEAKEALGIE